MYARGRVGTLPQKSALALSEYIQYKKYHKRWRKKDLAILEAFVEGGGDMPYDNTVEATTKRQLNRQDAPNLEEPLEIPSDEDDTDVDDKAEDGTESE